MMYAAKIDDTNTVVEVIVGDATWATERFGPTWIDSVELVGIGWTWDEIFGFRPLQPGPDCVWENGQWVCPEEPSEPVPPSD